MEGQDRVGQDRIESEEIGRAGYSIQTIEVDQGNV